MQRLALVALGLVVLAGAALAHPVDDLYWDPRGPLGEFRKEQVYKKEIQELRELSEKARPRQVRSFLFRAVGTWKCTGTSHVPQPHSIRGKLTLRRLGRSFEVTYFELPRRRSRFRVELDVAQAFVKAGGLHVRSDTAVGAGGTDPVMHHALDWQDADTLDYVLTTGDAETPMHEVTCKR